jgi:hypothetical protein
MQKRNRCEGRHRLKRLRVRAESDRDFVKAVAILAQRSFEQRENIRGA